MYCYLIVLYIYFKKTKLARFPFWGLRVVLYNNSSAIIAFAGIVIVSPLLLILAPLYASGLTVSGFSNVLYESMLFAVRIVPETDEIFTFDKSISIFCALSVSIFAIVINI
jgi:hypothetical protein